MSHRIKRREFITLVASAAATWPLAARAQQSTVPVIGYLTTFLGDATSRRFAEAFREGLKEQGFVEGQNVAVEYRSVEQGQYDQLRKMAADFVGRGIAVLFATPIPAAVAAKAATATTPISIRDRQRSSRNGAGRKLKPAGRECHGCHFLFCPSWREATGIVARTRA